MFDLFDSNMAQSTTSNEWKPEKNTQSHSHSHIRRRQHKLKPPIRYRPGKNIFAEKYVRAIIYFENVVVTQFSWNYTFQK